MWRAIGNVSPLIWGRSFLAALLRTALVADAPTVRQKSRIERAAEGDPVTRGSPIGPILPGPQRVN